MARLDQKSIRTKVLFVIFVLAVGGIGGVLTDRLVLPYLSTLPMLRGFKILNPAAPILITKREEIRITEGVNYTEATNSVRNVLATVYVHEGEFGGARFRLINTLTAVVATSDGILVLPSVNYRPEQKLTVVFPDSQVFPGKILAKDQFSGVSFLKIESIDLPVIKQGFSKDLQIGERLLAVWLSGSAGDIQVSPVVVAKRSLPQASLTLPYSFSELNTHLETDFAAGSGRSGAVLLNKDAALVGYLGQVGDKFVVLRSEDFKRSLDNLLDDGKIIWPALKMSYHILSAAETKLLKIPKNHGVLLTAATEPFAAGDFVYSLDGTDLTAEEGFQQVLLAKKPGEKVKFKLLRNGSDTEVEINL